MSTTAEANIAPMADFVVAQTDIATSGLRRYSAVYANSRLLRHGVTGVLQSQD
jgi:hypothetical protein